MQGDGKYGVEGHLEPRWSRKASPKIYLLGSQNWDNQGRTFQAQGTESAEALRWESGGCAEARGGKEFRFSGGIGEGSEQSVM